MRSKSRSIAQPGACSGRLTARAEARKRWAAAIRGVNVLRAGRSLEVLVSHLEKVLSEGKIKVESPKRLRDRVTSGWREHDVVLAISQGHHQLLVALECRDHSRPVDVSQVEAFHTKCQHTGIDVGVIVSTGGFYETARQKAQAMGLRCLTLEEATSFNWLLIPGLEVRRRRPNHLTIKAKVEGVDLGSSDCAIVDSTGRPVPPDALQAEVLEQFKSVPWDPQEETGISECELIPHGLFILEISTGRQIPVEILNCSMEYVVTKTLAPFKLARYTNVSSGEEITQAAIADMTEAGLPGSVVISYDPEKGGGVFFVKGQEESPGGKRKSAPNTAPAPDGEACL